MSIEVDVQIATTFAAGIPEAAQLARWARVAVQRETPSAELTVRVVDEREAASLNEQYRHRSGPTNVLSFPFESPLESSPELHWRLEIPLLGDVVVCAPVVASEARIQAKMPEAHWAHMVIHGALHLLGYDHKTSEEARDMEEMERAIINELGYPDPYTCGREQ